MTKEFVQLDWNETLRATCHQVFEAAKQEDLRERGDITSLATLPEKPNGEVVFRIRESGVIAGIECLQIAAALYDPELSLEIHVTDGQQVTAGESLAVVRGAAVSLLAMERPALNLLCRLSGIATLTRQWTDQIAGSPCRIYDTRKTVPGLRLLEKYAVRCGGGFNHRSDLSQAFLIKDNHLALAGGSKGPLPPAEAVCRAKTYMAEHHFPETTLIEIEVDTWIQFESAISEKPDIILLDNMPAELLARAVEYRNRIAPGVELEASGGITLAKLPAVAKTGIDRISVGALTHSATQVDIGLDWQDMSTTY